MRRLKMKENKTKGLLFTFCGLDGCGKTSMINSVIEYLDKEYPIYLTKQPTSAVRESDIFRTYMDSPNHEDYDYRSLSLMAASDRVQHVSKEIIPEMEKGKIVISDRYLYSCLANLRARGFYRDRWIYDVSKAIVKPTIAFFFDVPVGIAIERVRARKCEKDRYIDMELENKLRKEYVAICKANGGILLSTECSKEETFAKVSKEIRKVLK